MSVICYVALGGNLNNPLQQVTDAIEQIAAIADTEVNAKSSWYKTAPLGPAGQPDYINGVVELTTKLPPLKLLDALQSIEDKHERERKVRWGARTLDLDILLYGGQTISNDRLTVPHPEMQKRNFVLYPLAEICPNLVLPNGIGLKQLLENCPPKGIVRLS